MLSLSCACSTRQQSADSTPAEIAVDTGVLCDDAGEFFDSYSYVILETDSSSLIGEITHLNIDNTSIVFNSNDDVFIYNRKGQLVRHFNNKGQGPADYNDISDLKLHEDKIYLLSRFAHKINVYDKQGHHIDSYRFPYDYTTFSITGDKIWLASQVTDSSHFEFAEYNTRTDSIERTILSPMIREEYMFGEFNPFISNKGNSLYVTQFYKDAIATLDCITGKFDEYLNFRFDNNKEPDGDDKLARTLPFKLNIENQKIKDIGPMTDIGNNTYIVFDILYKVGYLHCLYKFNKTEPGHGKLLRIREPIYDKFPYLRSKPLLFYDGNYVSALDADRILDIETTEEIAPLNALSEDSNPVLFFHHMK